MMRKMVMAVISRDQADGVLDALIAAGYGATFTDSRGGMLCQAQKMVFVAVDADKVDDVLAIIRGYCRTKVEVEGGTVQEGGLLTSRTLTTAELGYAVIFVWDLEWFETC